MNRLVPISEASKLLGVSVPTLRRWEAEGRLIPEHTSGKHRRYDMLKLKLELYCAQQGWTFELISDLGSGMNYYKKGLKRLLNEIVGGNVGRLVSISHSWASSAMMSV